MARPEKPKGGLPPIPFVKLYTYATQAEIALICVAIVCACASGAILPLFSLVFGAALNILNDPSANIVDAITQLALYFFLLAIGAGVLTFGELLLVSITTERQMLRLRRAFVEALLRQDAAWHDTHRAGESVTRLAEATISVSTGLTKVASVSRYIATLVCGLAIGFRTSWKLTLVIAACAPLFAIALSILIITAISSEKAERTAYARAGDVANEVFSQIRAVAAYGGERHEVARYNVFLQAAARAGIRKGIGIGAAVGGMLFTFFAMYGIATYSGAIFVIESRKANEDCIKFPTLSGCFSGGDIITTFVAVLIGALAFGQIGPLMGAIGAARTAAADLYGVIDHVPGVDIFAQKSAAAAADTAMTPSSSSSGSSGGLRIEFRGVTFAYPSRPDVPVLNDFSLVISPGETLGVVGPSGCGKSTLVLLILRFYDPSSGVVLVDGIDVKEWNVAALRDLVGLVSQEPIVFGTSISANIAQGKPASRGAATREEVIAAATAANAHAFVSALPLGYDTLAGSGVASTQLSGGQRQRICIARALIKAPRALLCDEATSALDTTSERVVQAAIDNATMAGGPGSAPRTTLLIAHRLSTLANADRIVVLAGGRIMEEGSPAELSARVGGTFASMKAAQEVSDPGLAAAASSSTSAAVVVSSRSAALASAASKSESDETVSVVAVTATGAGAASAASPQQPKVSVLSRLWALQREDWPFVILGVLGALLSGAISPINSLIYSGMITIFFLPDNDQVAAQALIYLGYFFALGAGAYIGVLCRVSVFTYLGERLTARLRSAVFSAIVRQPLAFFDDPEHSVGRLSTRLATDAALVKGATGDALGSMVEGLGAIIAALVISFDASWRLALVLMAVFPFLILGQMAEFSAVARSSQGSNKELEAASDLVSEAVTATRTVAAFNLQASTLAAYTTALEAPLAAGVKRGIIAAAGQGGQRFALLCAYSLAFYAGARFISEGNLTFAALIRTFLAITLAAEAVGRISSQSPDTAKAEGAAKAIFALIDSGNASPIDPLADETVGKTVAHNSSSGGLRIEFRGVTFAYPSRPDVPVLNDFSLVISPGETLGVVGPSGCGKSTLVLLILRFYDPSSGVVLVDGIDVKEWNVAALRKHLGLVSQEPLLFADSCSYNIAYGAMGPTKGAPGQGVQPKESGDGSSDAASIAEATAVAAAAEAAAAAAAAAASTVGVDGTPAKSVGVAGSSAKGGSSSGTESVIVSVSGGGDAAKSYPPPSEEVLTAARSANALGFISALPAAFATYVGARGSLLSGGQRQRIAIARALLRTPRVLLLDEATAALDSTSERIVQAALDAVIANSAAQRTSLIIAHRLSTLANADRIIVLAGGRVAEEGSHKALMKCEGGLYRTLALAQGGK